MIITKHPLLGWAAAATAAAAAEEFPGNLHPAIPSHPGMKYPARHPPHFDEIYATVPTGHTNGVLFEIRVVLAKYLL